MLTAIQEYSYHALMKATIDVPDDLYRRVKAESALRAQTVREVTVALYRNWLDSSAEAVDEEPAVENSPPPAWFGAARSYAERVERHDMAAIRESVARGREATGDHS